MSYVLKESLLNNNLQRAIIAECNEIKLSSRNPKYPELFGTLPQEIASTAIEVVNFVEIDWDNYNPNKVNVDFYLSTGRDKREIYCALLEAPTVFMAFGCECKFLIGYTRYQLEELALPPGSVLVVYPAANSCLKFYYGIKHEKHQYSEVSDIPFSDSGTTIVTVQYLSKNLFDLLR